LSEGEHYLVEVRSAREIKLFQPVGTDTAIHIRIDSSWNKVLATAYTYDGRALGTVKSVIDGAYVEFKYLANLDGKQVGYYQITPAS
jgi:hypothetical protein